MPSWPSTSPVSRSGGRSWGRKPPANTATGPAAIPRRPPTVAFVAFKSGTLAALGSTAGSAGRPTSWKPTARRTSTGITAPPVLAGSVVVMTRMHAGDSWLAAFDRETGALRWKVARNYTTPTEGDQGYTTPLVISRDGRESILVWGAMHLTAHDPADGSLLWFCGGFNPDSKAFWPAVASPVVVDDVAIVPYGRSDRGEPRLHGIRLGGRGDVTATHRAWLRTTTGTFVPSPAAAEGRVILSAGSR